MKTILIVEDQLDVQNLLKVALQDSEYTLIHAMNASEGLKLAQLERPDLVLLDIMMPGEIDGFDLLNALKSDAQLAETKVIVVSARAQHQDQDAAFEAGALAYVTKPFRLSFLKSCIESALGDSRETPS